METTATNLMCGICPQCGGITLAPDDGRRLQDAAQQDLALLDCDRCGLEFTAPADDLLFQSIPLRWFSQGSA